ncbi:hypothetical protein Tco_1266133 [Tanacetum coccineum]
MCYALDSSLQIPPPKNPQSIVPLARFTFHDRVMNPLDISWNPIKEKGKKVAPPSSPSSSSSSDENKVPSFLEFYEELSDNEDLTDAQKEKNGMFKWLNCYFGKNYSTSPPSSFHKEYEHRGLNFVGIGKDIHVFVGNLNHVVDFTIFENVEANIDPSLSQVVFGRPFMETTKLILDKEKGLVTFTNGIKEVNFKTPYKDPEMKGLTSKGNDLLASRVILSDDDFRRGCKSSSNLENRIYKDIDKLDSSYNWKIERLDIEGSFETKNSRTSKGVT